MGSKVTKLSVTLILCSLILMFLTKIQCRTDAHFTRLDFLPLLTLTSAHFTLRLSLVTGHAEERGACISGWVRCVWVVTGWHRGQRREGWVVVVAQLWWFRKEVVGERKSKGKKGVLETWRCMRKKGSALSNYYNPKVGSLLFLSFFFIKRRPKPNYKVTLRGRRTHTKSAQYRQ